MISVDDYTPSNYVISDIVKKYGMEKNFIFFLDLKDGAEEMAKRLSSEGFIIGSHTVNHKPLTEISEQETRYELKESKTVIERWTGKECEWFAYPYGLFNNKVVKAVKNAGYKYARTCKKEDDGKFKLGCFEMSGKNWDKATERKYPIYQMHYYNLEQNNSFNQFNQFLIWYKNETSRNTK